MEWIIKLPLILIWWAILAVVADGLSGIALVIWIIAWVGVAALVLKATNQ
jgi:ABC-type dipeptide/oligopeptide/nickel transport system permease subunit